MKTSNLLVLAMALGMATLYPVASWAEDDPETRIRQLEQMMQQMMQQRAEQDKQIEMLTKELAGIENQLSQVRITKAEEKGSSKGSPVYAAFKDGITFEDGTGNWKLAINGRVQADYREFSPDADAADTFSLRRARLGATLTFYKDFVARVEGEYSGGSTTLTYGYIDINKLDYAHIRIGQFKPSYGLERATSSNFTDFQERSMADVLLGNTFDRGVMVYGSPVMGLNYSVAYVNGTGTSDENNAKVDSKDFTARLTANIAEWAGWKDSVVHIGGFYADGSEGARRQQNFIPAGITEARGATFFSTTCSSVACGTAIANGFSENLKRERYGYETALSYKSLKLQGEYINTGYTGRGVDRDIHAWYASAMWNVTGETFARMYKEGVFGRLRPMHNYTSGGGGWGAVQLGIRYSRFDASDFTALNAAGSGVLLNTPAATGDGVLVATNEADAWTLGANWILNPNVRFVANWVRTNYDTPLLVRVNGLNKSLDKEDAITMRAQFDF